MGAVASTGAEVASVLAVVAAAWTEVASVLSAVAAAGAEVASVLAEVLTGATLGATLDLRCVLAATFLVATFGAPNLIPPRFMRLKNFSPFYARKLTVRELCRS